MWDLTLFNSALFPSHNLFNPHFTLFLHFLPFLPLSLLHRHIYAVCIHEFVVFPLQAGLSARTVSDVTAWCARTTFS